MSPVFLDTVGLIALWDTDDQWHAAADSAYQQIISQRKPAVTTTYILLECGNTAARRTFRADVCALRQTLERCNELIVPTEADGLEHGLLTSVEKPAKRASLTTFPSWSCVGWALPKHSQTTAIFWPRASRLFSGQRAYSPLLNAAWSPSCAPREKDLSPE